MKDDRVHLLHILECIGRVNEYTTAGKESFLRDHRTQDAVLRNLQTLAESATRLSPELRARQPQVDWRGIGGFRNVLVHNYLGINLDRVWTVIQNDLPKLKRAVEVLLNEST